MAGRVFFIEDYDLRIARFLVAGVDLWLNTPRRPLEASGTSGMKAALNGVPSLSVLDGWWDEAFDGSNGWAVGGRAEAWARCRPTRRTRSRSTRRSSTRSSRPSSTGTPCGLPRAWIGFMRGALRTGLAEFTTERVLHDYVDELYRPVAGVSEVRTGTG